jgi:hypothetical protein
MRTPQAPIHSGFGPQTTWREALGPRRLDGKIAVVTVWCATSPQLDGKGGVYCEDVDIAAQVPTDFPEPRGVRPWATDAELAERLWANSEEWTGAKLGA